MRRLSLSVMVLVLCRAPAALAAAGGGSSGFGGGGGGGSFGGGGGGSFGGGGYGGGSAHLGRGSFIGIFAILGVIAAFMIAGAILGWIAERRRRRERSARARRVTTAAAEAADDDPAFAPDTVMGQATALFGAIQAAWSANDRAALARMVGRDLMVEWTRRLDDFEQRGWTNRVSVLGGAELFYVGMVNRPADAEDRAVVLIEATVEDVVIGPHGATLTRSDSKSPLTRMREYWTLAKLGGDDRWMLLSIEQLAEGDHNLSDELVASPWGDERVRDDSLVEGAVADAAPAGTAFGELVDIDYAGDGRAQALDLSLVDPRFSPDVLEVCVRRALAGWAEAVDGADDALLAVATPEAVRALLYPGGGGTARVVVRGPRLEKLTIAGLDSQAHPARMGVDLALSGRRYVEDRDTLAVLEGSRDRPAAWRERWMFELADDAQNPWRVVAGEHIA